MQAYRPPTRLGVEPSSSLSQRSKPATLPNIAVQSFAAFRQQTSTSPAPSPVRRKPLPATASPIVGRFSSAEFSTPSLVGDKDINKQRSYSINSPPLQPPSRLATILSPPLSADEDQFLPRNLDEFKAGRKRSSNKLVGG
ncbi:hypothetical protein BCR34DRAFT_255742 [Clohesyomyces aquaticus]|uniref:Uncharacterized protein n=1 Tax=Clohesyomyces aquaticus TaxID=1231657 RepID=A0A1Y1ZTZ1_9PLEO|nr:hypothetical protein BCR34DRAFT_255742 [Clohesyomyces aquaticus]